MKRTLLLPLVLLLTALVMVDPAPANPGDYRHCDAIWWQNLQAQHARSLASPLARVRSMTLDQIAYFARHYTDRAPYDVAIDPLLSIYATDHSSRMRVKALRALEAIGDPASMDRLRNLVQYEKSPEVRQLTMAVLYGSEPLATAR